MTQRYYAEEFERNRDREVRERFHHAQVYRWAPQVDDIGVRYMTAYIRRMGLFLRFLARPSLTNLALRQQLSAEQASAQALHNQTAMMRGTGHEARTPASARQTCVRSSTFCRMKPCVERTAPPSLQDGFTRNGKAELRCNAYVDGRIHPTTQ